MQTAINGNTHMPFNSLGYTSVRQLTKVPHLFPDALSLPLNHYNIDIRSTHPVFSGVYRPTVHKRGVGKGGNSPCRFEPIPESSGTFDTLRCLGHRPLTACNFQDALRDFFQLVKTVALPASALVALPRCHTESQQTAIATQPN